MSRKMKGVVLDSSSYGVHGFAKKHQTLLQDYQDLTKDVEASRNKLENLKRRKMTLMAEVGFLRRRYKYLLKNKSQNLPQEREKEFEQPHNSKNSTGYPNFKGKQAAVQKSNVAPKPNQKRKVYGGHDNSFRSVNLNHLNHEKQHTEKPATHINTIQTSKPRGRLYTTKEVTHQNPLPVFDLNQQEQMYYKNDVAVGNPSLIFNSYQKESPSSSVKQPPMQTRAPVFDLNQISVNN
ncbi:uncharacterized protein LOC108219747 [Daucus carota subsp. sativus]|uniref:uncharacterized protein LOC108219747 n=1 Tax=Daucus carota subsp. sativus TaxID=79200 RepID=UPI0007EFD12A|nr:PREDICTED: uncharacterized protein LOC108219747 [Daucus carota subsp. sativus]